MIAFKRLALASPLLLALVVSIHAAVVSRPKSVDLMTEAATRFLGSLTDEQRATATFEFGDDVRFDWHYVPKPSRKGLTFKDMNADQAQAAHTLVSAGLSRSGYAKAVTIMSQEELIRQIDEAAGRTRMLSLRNPLLYHFSIFGKPDPKGTWGWSVEGHHISLNFTIVNGEFVATTPAMFGSEPHHVTKGGRKGQRVLGAEEDFARELLDSLSPAHRSRAIVGDKGPNDMLTAAARKLEFESPAKGLPASELSNDQKSILKALIDTYIYNVPDDLAAEREAQAAEADPARTYFAWMGETDRSLGRPYYYRVQAPTFLIEFSTSLNNVNHIHTVWRDYDGDFGRDLLAEHHKNAH